MEQKQIHSTSIGGQSIIEGVMMRGVETCGVAVRNPEGEIVTKTEPVPTITKKYRILRLPILRGIVNLVETMRFGYKTLMYSAEIAGVEETEEGPGKFEKWLTRVFGDKLMTVFGVVASVLAVCLALFLFMFLPSFLVKLVGGGLPGAVKSIREGRVKIAVFVLYLYLVSRMKDIQRVFEYHGAEHKTIFCYENGEELTVENVRKFQRFHPRCGTSFLLIVLIISILVSSVVTWDVLWMRVLIKIASLPLVVGISYEIIKYAGRHDNPLTFVLSRPGLWLQRLTTREPDDSQLEVAITSLKLVLTGNPEDDKW